MAGIRDLQRLLNVKSNQLANPHNVFVKVINLLGGPKIDGLEPWLKGEIAQCGSKVMHRLYQNNKYSDFQRNQRRVAGEHKGCREPHK